MEQNEILKWVLIDLYGYEPKPYHLEVIRLACSMEDTAESIEFVRKRNEDRQQELNKKLSDLKTLNK